MRTNFTHTKVLKLSRDTSSLLLAYNKLRTKFYLKIHFIYKTFKLHFDKNIAVRKTSGDFSLMVNKTTVRFSNHRNYTLHIKSQKEQKNRRKLLSNTAP